MLSVGYVEQDRVTFASLVPTLDIKLRESEHLKYYEVIIWEETSTVHFYEFPNDFNSWYGYDIISVSEDGTPGLRRNDLTDQQIIAYREGFLISKYTDMPEAWTDARSTFLKSAFTDIALYLVNRHPGSEHHLKFRGHGGPGGRLFSAHLARDDANDFLKFWSHSLGRALGVLDMGGPCNKGSFADLDNFCHSAKYYIASDLLNGGYSLDEFTWTKREEVWPLTQYHNLFAVNRILEESLKGRIDLKRKAYEYSRNNMVANEVAQANYLYSCTAFLTFSTGFKSFLGSAGVKYRMSDDLYDYMTENGASPSLFEQFNNVIVHKADNKDFFEWNEIRNGMLMPDQGLLVYLQSLPRPFVLEIISGDGQQGLPGNMLAHPLIVEVRDQYSDPLPDTPVTFRVTAGEGTLSVTNVATDSTGRVATNLTLGKHPGVITIEVAVAELAPKFIYATGKATTDFDGDGTVGFSDFLKFAAQFGLNQSDVEYDARFDLDGDGAIGFGDFLIFAIAFGKEPSST